MIKLSSVFMFEIKDDKQKKRAFKLWRIEKDINCGVDISESTSGIISLYPEHMRGILKEWSLL